MDSKFVERFQNYENLLFLYQFFKKKNGCAKIFTRKK